MNFFSRTIILIFILHTSREMYSQCISTFPHVEDFESGPVWTSNLFYPATGNDWAWGTPAHPTINIAGSGTKSWCVGTLSGSFYTFYEQSWVQSPCYDFTNLQYPHIALKIFYESEWKYDGAKLQYSIDNGNTWVTIGAYGDPNDCNTENWYNTNATSSYSSGTITGGGTKPVWFPTTDPTAKDSWAGNTHPVDVADDPTHPGVTCYCCHGPGHWLVAQHCLTGLAGKPNVIFRITFSCGYACNNFDGFAFDSVAVSNGIQNAATFNYTCGNPNTLNFTATPVACPTNSYSWNFGDPASGSNTSTTQNPSHTFSGTGTYTVTLIASGGACNPPDTLSKVVTITTATVSAVNANCSGGSASVIVSGGTQPYTYTWSNGQTTSSVSNLTAGNYSVTVSAANSCPITNTVAITQPAAMTSSVSTINSSCASSTGTSTVTTTGGSPAYSYFWSTTPVQTTAIATGLSAGTYSVMITDANGCTSSATATVMNSNGPVVSANSLNVTCNGANNGTAVITASGGTGQLTYSWFPTGGNNPTASGLVPGTYTCIVSDAAGCMQPQSVVITEPTIITASVSATQASCNIGGSATVSANGGTGTLTYLWNPSGETTPTATGLNAGNYTVNITDANGCIQTATIIVTSASSIAVTLQSQTNVSCNGGSDGIAVVNVTGGSSPYSYNWSVSGGTNAIATGLSAGTYNCTITDANGCSQMQPVSITQPPPIILTSTSTPVPCGLSDGTASIIASGGVAPYTYLWLTTPVQTNSQISNLAIGSYSIVVTDASGCTQIQSVSVPQNGASPHADFIFTPDVISWLDPSVNFTNNSSVSSAWQWSFGDGNFSTLQNPSHTYSDTGNYCITLIVSDSVGTCKDSITKCLSYDCTFTFYIPNAFTPNNDAENDLFFGKGLCIKDFQMYIFDRWGNKIFESNDINKGWDGKVQNGVSGKIAQEDIYVWKVNLTEFNGKEHNYVGQVSLIK